MTKVSKPKVLKKTFVNKQLTRKDVLRHVAKEAQVSLTQANAVIRSCDMMKSVKRT